MDANTKAWGPTSKGKTLHLFTEDRPNPACNSLIDLRSRADLLTYDEAQVVLTGWWAVQDGLKLCSRCVLVYARWAAESAPAEPEEEPLLQGSVRHLSLGNAGTRVETVLTEDNVDDVRRWISRHGRNFLTVPYETRLDDEGEVHTVALKIPGDPHRIAYLGDTVVRHPDEQSFSVLAPEDAAELEELRTIVRRLGGHKP